MKLIINVEAYVHQVTGYPKEINILLLQIINKIYLRYNSSINKMAFTHHLHTSLISHHVLNNNYYYYLYIDIYSRKVSAHITSF